MYNLKRGSSSIGDLADGFGSAFLPALIGNTYFVNPSLSVSGSGTVDDPFNSVLAAYNQCTDGANDVVFMIGQSSAWSPAASLTWSKSYTHLIGISSPLPGMGQRCRIVGSASVDISPVITFSGTGCIVSNIQIFNGKDADSSSGAVIVSGARNAFINVFFAGMGHATPAARTDSYSLKVTGAENLFADCTIGLDTIDRSAANYELWLSTGSVSNTFKRCHILSQSDTNTRGAVLIDGMDRWVIFDDCLFENFSVNWATAITNAFSITVATTHYVILRGACQFVGYTGIADTLTHIYGAGPAPNSGMFLSTKPAA